MCFEVGGVQFPANTFAGWYSLPEVATRDLLDRQRYDVMEVTKGNELFDLMQRNAESCH